MVLYKCTFEDSGTLRSLAEAVGSRVDLAQRIALLVFDNSPEPQPSKLEILGYGAIEYIHAPENGGLATAYNQGLFSGRQKGCEWLLLLDQDTVLHSLFFPALFAAIELPPPMNIAAIVPKLVLDEKVLSPQVLARFNNHDLPLGFSGVFATPITALNSGASLRIKAVVAVGGFPQEYWLDYLDHIMFHRLQAGGGRVMILDVAIEHRLSLHNIEKEMSLSRYASVLAAEWRFVRETGTGGGPMIHRLRLLKRALSYATTLRNKAYARQTLRAALEWKTT